MNYYFITMTAKYGYKIDNKISSKAFVNFISRCCCRTRLLSVLCVCPGLLPKKEETLVLNLIGFNSKESAQPEIRFVDTRYEFADSND